jgi:hypothetical protein
MHVPAAGKPCVCRALRGVGAEAPSSRQHLELSSSVHFPFCPYQAGASQPRAMASSAHQSVSSLARCALRGIGLVE